MGDHRRHRVSRWLGARSSIVARDERGATAIIFAIAALLLVPLVFGLFDVYTTGEQRVQLQDSLDAATLLAARSSSNIDSEIDALGKKGLSANLKLIRGATLLSSDFHLADNNTKVVGTATVQPLALVPWFWAHPPVTAHSEVIRSSKNLEVALVLDVTKSMNSNNKIGDLRVAAQELVELVVKPQQTPFYSKVAVVPWSNGVNPGAYINQVRGAVTPAKTITAASWAATASKTITGATRANPVVISSALHGLANGDKVFITGVNGMTQINNKVYTVAGAALNTFQLSGVNGASYNSYSTPSNGTVTKCQISTCSLVVTSASHGFVNGNTVVVKGIGGITTALTASGGSSHNVNDYVYTVSNSAANTFALTEAVAASGAYTSGGSAYCTNYGCQYYKYTAASGGAKVLETANCVTERVTAQQYTDAAPSTAYVGFNYPPNAAVLPYTVSQTFPCLSNTIIPLSTDKVAVKAAINVLLAEGTTAGHVGVAWGWYMVSPNFAYLWPAASQPAAYTAPNTLKVVVLMTDGALNTAYCHGVSAQDSSAGNAADRINCNATNGSTLSQSLTLCQNMKTAGVIVYTVGFDIAGDANAQTLMAQCASGPNYQHLASTGAQLTAAFKAIGADLNNLRVAH